VVASVVSGSTAVVDDGVGSGQSHGPYCSAVGEAGVLAGADRAEAGGHLAGHAEAAGGGAGGRLRSTPVVELAVVVVPVVVASAVSPDVAVMPVALKVHATSMEAPVRTTNKLRIVGC
jgi:hypothetical protein